MQEGKALDIKESSRARRRMKEVGEQSLVAEAEQDFLIFGSNCRGSRSTADKILFDIEAACVALPLAGVGSSRDYVREGLRAGARSICDLLSCREKRDCGRAGAARAA